MMTLPRPADVRWRPSARHPLEHSAVDEGEDRDGEPRHTPRGHRPALGRRPRDEHRSGGHQPDGCDEERTRRREHLLHGHHGRAPQEERRYQRNTAEHGEEPARGILLLLLLRPDELVSLVLAKHARHVLPHEHALHRLVAATGGFRLGRRMPLNLRVILGGRRTHHHAAPTFQTRACSQPQRRLSFSSPWLRSAGEMRGLPPRE